MNTIDNPACQPGRPTAAAQRCQPDRRTGTPSRMDNDAQHGLRDQPIVANPRQCVLRQALLWTRAERASHPATVWVGRPGWPSLDRTTSARTTLAVALPAAREADSRHGHASGASAASMPPRPPDSNLRPGNPCSRRVISPAEGPWRRRGRTAEPPFFASSAVASHITERAATPGSLTQPDPTTAPQQPGPPASPANPRTTKVECIRHTLKAPKASIRVMDEVHLTGLNPC